MKALRTLRRVLYSPAPTHVFHAFLSAQPQHHHEDPTASADSDSVFDSSRFAHGEDARPGPGPSWDEKYRARADRVVFGEEGPKGKLRLKEEEDERRRRVLAKALLEAAMDGGEEEEEGKGAGVVKEEDQKSLSVGIIGAPNAGKSALTNYMVGTKVAAVSRKTNTTTHEVVGVLTKGDTQICIFDTPGLMLNCGGFPYRDVKARVESAWSSINLYEVLIVILMFIDILPGQRPDSRVIKLIKRMGARSVPNQRRILCMNKIDLVEKKKDLLKIAEEFKDLPGYERHFMISGLKGAGIKDLTQYLMEQAGIFLLLLSTRFQRPWEEDPFTMSEEVMKMIALEVVRERLLDYVHQEIPYDVEHRLIDWKELRDGSLRIEQHFITNKLSQHKILVGKNGSKIGRIGIEANEELRLFGI
ncbi:GTP-binding protein ERG [Spatholobus suberectus]|nr:GTP-binding protein ERG [Spatholobus suberectus]